MGSASGEPRALNTTHDTTNPRYVRRADAKPLRLLVSSLAPDCSGRLGPIHPELRACGAGTETKALDVRRPIRFPPRPFYLQPVARCGGCAVCLSPVSANRSASHHARRFPAVASVGVPQRVTLLPSTPPPPIARMRVDPKCEPPPL